eukprot:168711-Amphidinium_carterae.1
MAQTVVLENSATAALLQRAEHLTLDKALQLWQVSLHSVVLSHIRRAQAFHVWKFESLRVLETKGVQASECHIKPHYVFQNAFLSMCVPEFPQHFRGAVLMPR